VDPGQERSGGLPERASSVDAASPAGEPVAELAIKDRWQRWEAADLDDPLDRFSVRYRSPASKLRSPDRIGVSLRAGPAAPITALVRNDTVDLLSAKRHTFSGDHQS
jgi:hypothetical protein